MGEIEQGKRKILSNVPSIPTRLVDLSGLANMKKRAATFFSCPMRIWWHLRKQYNMDVEIQVKENAFILISYPNNPSTSP